MNLMIGRILVALLVASLWLGFGSPRPVPALRPEATRSPQVAPPVSLPPRTAYFTGQGFDTCEVPTLAALQAWFVRSPYRVVNLYIGGAGRYCSNRALTADLVAQLAEIGWQFIPTWVGPQAPCYTGRKLRMSDDPAVAYAQGVAEAGAAAKTAASLGLARADGSGTIIYYDMEAYASNVPACDDPVRAFVAGWTAELHARGNLAGVYSTPHALTGFAAIPNVPDAVWPARWLYTAYNPDVTVWEVPGLAPTLWAHRQRIWQYAGGHDEAWQMEVPDGTGYAAMTEERGRHAETWGGITLNIDCDVIDGIVATGKEPAGNIRIYLPAILRGEEPARR